MLAFLSGSVNPNAVEAAGTAHVLPAGAGFADRAGARHVEAAVTRGDRGGGIDRR